MLPACATDSLAAVLVEGVIHDDHRLGAMRKQQAYHHHEDPFGHIVRIPYRSGKETINGDEVLDFMKARGGDHVAHGVPAHRQYPTSRQSSEVTLARCAEAGAKICLLDLKRLRSMSPPHGVAPSGHCQSSFWRERLCLPAEMAKL